MPTAQAIREQAERICKHLPDQQADLLRYVIEEHLAGRELTEISIGEGFFGQTSLELRADSKDGKDKRPSNTRVGMRNLRKKLEAYYDGTGHADFVHISFRKRQYVPIVKARFDDLSEKSRRLLRRAGEAREKRSASGYAEAIRLLNEILADGQDENAVILGRLAEIHALRVLHSIVRPRPEMELAYQFAQRSLARSPRTWAAHVVVGAFHACVNWDWNKAEDAFDDAVKIGGDHVKTLPWAITLYNAQGHAQELIEFLEDYISELSDSGPLIRRNLATALMLCGRFEEAIREYESAFPHYLAHMYIAMIYDAVGDHEKALEQARIGSERPDSQFRAPGLLIMTLAKAGKREEALAKLAALEVRAEYVSRFELAIAHMGFAEYERALDYLEMACDEREYLMLFLPHWPMFRPIHKHPRFLALVKRMGLPDPRPSLH